MNHIKAQLPDSLPPIILEQSMEQLAEITEEEEDLSDLTEELEQLAQHPVNLNSSAGDELLRLPMLNELQVQNLKNYIDQYGMIASIYELQLIEGFNQEFICQIAPYITLDYRKEDTFNWKTALKHSRLSLSARFQTVLPTQSGFNKDQGGTYYLGRPGTYCFKLTASNKDRLKYGFIAEQDAGEPFLKRYDHKPPGFDFYSGYIFLKDLGKFRQIVVGDYHLHFGQGLTLWNGFSFGGAAGILPGRKRGATLAPSGSSNENRFFRGGAATMKLGRVDITGFYSNYRKDGNLAPLDSTLSEEVEVTSLLFTGYHRTNNELTNRKSIREIVMGGTSSYQGKHFRLGISGFHLDHDRKIVKRTSLYSGFQLPETNGDFLGMDFSYIYKRLTLFGESTHRIRSGSAHYYGINFSPDPRLSFAFIYRNFSKSFKNPFSGVSGFNTTNTNEHSMYFGLTTTPVKSITITASAEYCRYPWLHYRVDAPSRAVVMNVIGEYAFSRKGFIRLRYRYFVSPLNEATESAHTNSILDITKKGWQFQFRYEALPGLITGNRLYFLLYRQDGIKGEQGYYISQELSFHPPGRKWGIQLSYSLFDTDSYNARIYTYETDLPSSFSVPAFTGQGTRFYLMTKLVCLNRLEAWFRYSVTSYPGQHSIAEGLNRIEGNIKSEVKVMVKLRISY